MILPTKKGSSWQRNPRFGNVLYSSKAVKCSSTWGFCVTRESWSKKDRIWKHCPGRIIKWSMQESDQNAQNTKTVSRTMTLVNELKHKTSSSFCVFNQKTCRCTAADAHSNAQHQQNPHCTCVMKEFQFQHKPITLLAMVMSWIRISKVPRMKELVGLAVSFGLVRRRRKRHLHSSIFQTTKFHTDAYTYQPHNRTSQKNGQKTHLHESVWPKLLNILLLFSLTYWAMREPHRRHFQWCNFCDHRIQLINRNS